MIRLEGVSKRYVQGTLEVSALRAVSLHIPAGRFVSIMGPSGSGKSTLLNLIGALDTPSAGEIWIDGVAIGGLDDDARTRLRRERLGFVFQFFNLLPTLSALENASLPALLAGRPRAEVLPRARALLERFGLGARVDHGPTELSGGEMQRVAIARALIMEPRLLLADEPTGNLDSRSGESILQLLTELCRELGRTIVMVTHDSKAAAHGDAIIELKDGEVVVERELRPLRASAAG